MKKISFVVGKDYQNNRIFNLSDKHLNRDNCLYPYFLLKEEFKARGYELNTSDIVSPELADLVIYNEMPKPFPNNIDPSKSYLLLFETDLIRPDNWEKEKHKSFKKIFTWNDKIVDGKKYIKFNFPNEVKVTLPGISGRDKLLTSISGNKTSSHPLELYSARLEAIKWFSKNCPKEFMYYGVGWEYPFSLKIQKGLRKLKLLSLFPKNTSPSYGGRVDEKISVLKTFKFALCFENGRDIDGYITEKIFDCLFAGTIPVYWGANNIYSYIPEECLVDRRNFKSNEELYHYLKSMSDKEVIHRQEKIQSFLKSEQMIPFTDKYFATNIIGNILNE